MAPAKKQPKHHRTTDAGRALAVECYLISQKKTSVAKAALLKQWDSKVHGDKPVDLDHFITRTYDRFHKYATLKDLPRAARKPAVPGARLDDAVDALVSGYEITRTYPGRRGKVVRHKGYGNFAWACQHNQTLRAICDEFNLGPSGLYRKIKKHCPDLRWRAVDFKRALNIGAKMQRQHAAATTLDLIKRDATYLDRVVWIDETKIWLWSGKGARMHIYTLARAEGVDEVIEIDQMPHGTHPIQVHLYVAVNAQLGPIMLQFTSGTTDITRDYEHLFEGPVDGDYKVNS